MSELDMNRILSNFQDFGGRIGQLESTLSSKIGAQVPGETMISARHKWIMGGLAALSGAGVITIAGLAKAFENVKGEKDAANKALGDEKTKKPVPLVGEWPLDKRETFMVVGGLALVLLGLAYFSSSGSSGSSAPPPPVTVSLPSRF